MGRFEEIRTCADKAQVPTSATALPPSHGKYHVSSRRGSVRADYSVSRLSFRRFYAARVLVCEDKGLLFPVSTVGSGLLPMTKGGRPSAAATTEVAKVFNLGT